MCKVTVSTFQFVQQFSDEKSAREWLERNRWGDNPKCPRCEATKSITARKGRRAGYYHCGHCKKEFHVRIGTVMEASHIPLQKWLYAMYLMTTARRSISSLQLSKEIGITQKSTWFMLHRLREACRNDDTMLTGIVEIDETYIGGNEGNKHANRKRGDSQGGSGKDIVLGMRQRGGKVKAMPIPDTTNKTLTKALCDKVIGSNIKYEELIA